MIKNAKVNTANECYTLIGATEGLRGLSPPQKIIKMSMSKALLT